MAHAGQHCDDKMSKVLFEEMELTQPSINLGIGFCPHSEMVGWVIAVVESLIKAKCITLWEQAEWVELT